MPERSYSSPSYRYGFNGMEKDDEVKGSSGTSYDFGARLYDSRLGRWLAVDPLAAKYPEMSPYVSMANNPIMYSDVLGDTIVISWHKEGGKTIFDKVNEGLVKEQVNDGVFILSAHGSSKVIQDDRGESYKQYSTPEAIMEQLMSNEEFSKAVKDGNVTLILKSCNTGTRPIDQYGESWFKDKKSIAQKISEKYDGIKVIAPNGAVVNGVVKDDWGGLMNTRSKGKYGIVGLDKETACNGEQCLADTDSNDGAWLIFESGVNTGEKYTGNVKAVFNLEIPKQDPVQDNTYVEPSQSVSP